MDACVTPGIKDITSKSVQPDPASIPYGTRFQKEVVDVAARIPLSALRAYDFSYMSQLLSDSLDHNAEQWTDAAKYFFAQQAALRNASAVTSIIAAIASIIPVAGAILSKGISAVAKAASDAAAQIDINIVAGRNIRVTPDFNNATPETRMVLGNPKTDMFSLNTNQNGTTDLIGRFSRFGLLPKYIYTASGRAGIAEPPNFQHARLFTRTDTGYVFPWLSAGIGVENNKAQRTNSYATYAQMVGRRALLYRCLDLMICQFWGAVRLEKGKLIPGSGIYANSAIDQWWWGAPGTYRYVNPRYGALWGSTIPPFPGEDTPLKSPITGYAIDDSGFEITPKAVWTENVSATEQAARDVKNAEFAREDAEARLLDQCERDNDPCYGEEFCMGDFLGCEIIGGKAVVKKPRSIAQPIASGVYTTVQRPTSAIQSLGGTYVPVHPQIYR